MLKLLPLLTIVALSVAFGADRAAAQPPDAIPAACSSDFTANCSPIQPGDEEALQCLLEHGASLSRACTAAIDAIAPPQASPAPASPPAVATRPAVETRAAEGVAARPSEPSLGPTPKLERRKLVAIVQACRQDRRAHCSDVKRGGGRILACLIEHAAYLSRPCKRAMSAVAVLWR